MPKRYHNKYQEGGQVPSDIRRLLSRLTGGRDQERRQYNQGVEDEMERASRMRANLARLSESHVDMGDFPEWMLEDDDLVTEYIDSQPIKRPLPPLVTRENVGMMTPEEIKRWGGGNASGGIIALQGGGGIGDDPDPIPMIRPHDYGTMRKPETWKRKYDPRRDAPPMAGKAHPWSGLSAGKITAPEHMFLDEGYDPEHHPVFEALAGATTGARKLASRLGHVVFSQRNPFFRRGRPDRDEWGRDLVQDLMRKARVASAYITEEDPQELREAYRERQRRRTWGEPSIFEEPRDMRASGGIISLQDGGVIGALRDKLGGLRDRISEYAEENPPMGSPGWSPRWGPSRFGEGSLDPDRAMDSDQLRERQREILETLGNIPRGLGGILKRAGEGFGDYMEDLPRLPGPRAEKIDFDDLPSPGDQLREMLEFPGQVLGRGSLRRELDPDQERRGIIPLLLDRIRGRAGGGVIGFQAGGNPYQQRMVQSYVSPEVAQPYADLTSRIQQVGGRAYTPYGGQRLAATTGDQALARAAYGAYGRGPGPAGTGQAAATMSQAGQMIGGAQQGLGGVASKFGAFAPLAQQQAEAGAAGMRGVGEQAGSPEMQREANLSQYMSQYTQGAIDPQLRQIREQAAAQRAEIGAQAGSAGAFGGYRHGLQEQAAGQEAQQRMQDVTAKGYEKAFQDAVSGFQADRAAQAAGHGQQLQAQQQAGALEQQGFGTMGNLWRGEQGAYGQMGGLGAQMGQLGTAQQQQAQREQQMQYERLQGMEQAGARTQQEQQRDYDIAYQDFQRQQQHPQQMADWQLQAMSQLPYQNTQVIGDYGQAPGMASDITGAAGAYHKYQTDQATAGDPAADAAAGDVAPTPDVNVPVEGEVVEENTEVTPPGHDLGAAHGGYLASSGILAPYHKKLIDGLYAGGRINY